MALAIGIVSAKQWDGPEQVSRRPNCHVQNNIAMQIKTCDRTEVGFGTLAFPLFVLANKSRFNGITNDMISCDVISSARSL
jgi:hypothetical protein